MSELVTLLHLSEQFLDHVESGANPESSVRLAKFINRTPVVDLRLRLAAQGFDKIGGPTAKFLALQKTFLKIKTIGGQFKAASAARKLHLRDKLDTYRRQLVVLPCMDVNGRLIKAGDAASSDFLVSTKTASFGAISILILGVAAFVIFDRIHKTNSRRKKRFICRAACTIGTAGSAEMAEGQIVDVSRLGAKVKSEDLACDVGAELEVHLPKKRLNFSDHTVTYDPWSFMARVLWKNGDYLGLEFREMLAQEYLDQLVASR
ncbi:PilZ domain-containing protein [Pseudophaeobacter flagellatus]|uniref:PilZ domain-containing protein n=1 Tax=Pseudophaeobacter flagellatus TaxID=2899119 RepID=UPI001E3B4970|nr:PilZ domain-containing protein [Pseudophaeobacter flagellatus]MCD9146714.1 PilZ domain-containing protein [Pseudophaeobacter flagellatus]